MELISEYLAADTSPDASADALAIINIGYMWSCIVAIIAIFEIFAIMVGLIMAINSNSS